MERLGNSQIVAAGLADWRALGQGLHARYLLDDLAAGAAFAVDVAPVVDGAADGVELRLRPGSIDLTLYTVEDGRWVTSRDVDRARGISEIARRRGLTAAPRQVAQLELALDTPSHERVGPFWAALLTGDAGNTVYDSVFDPSDRVPAVWFQITDEHETPRQRWHFDLWLAPEVADERIAAAVAAGGTLVYDGHAPMFTILADPDGNRVCVCTSTGRD
ncbi:4a-hydroxytetrahydrobiopterin dehydratase [Jatrophihabitans endophyticus]|uniref:4a-hydroxytetrahydrobiopterin dehydratase n=1 Tax=Jatrophihabitans endophyticus TaxID=1206085 RepID=A0A1M5T5Q2_9ACTN|nr:VOC family protein [Jatrophihabitans endophyticus]SHH45920.1 4a-hydroxytetrahydrobiopterin dehydratase [Jatrophihabitans endophyticus]